MKYIKSYIFFVLTVFALTGCNQYDDLKDDVNDLKDRVALIEQQVTLLNDNLAVISYILDTQHKTISKVEKSADGTQHVITLSNGEKLTLTIGKPGTIKEPVITVGADKMWYVNGVSTGVVAVGQDGKNGDGFPEFRVENGKWQVRFGGGLWGDVAGSENIAPGSLGDQFFESAKVEGNQFVVTMKQKEGEAAKVYNVPIVDALTCSIDPNGNTLNRWGYYEFDPAIAGNERKIFLVKVEGDNPQVTYPQGWRAELKKLETADANGNNYQLVVYAPETTQPITRAAADNTKDVTVQVQKGAFWAMAKIPVGLPKVYNTLLEKYNEANESFYVGGLEIDHATYGDAKEINTDNYDVSAGGIFIVSTNGLTLTYSSTTNLSKLIIVPNTSDINITLAVNAQLKIASGTVIACQNVKINSVLDPMSRCYASSGIMAFDNCNLNLSNKGLVMSYPSVQTLSYFEMTGSKMEINASTLSVSIVKGVNCDKCIFNNNIIYYSGTPSITASDRVDNFKIYDGKTNEIQELVLTSNTLIDLESCYSANASSALVYAKETKKGTIKNNLYYFTYQYYSGFLIRNDPAPGNTVFAEPLANNYGYALAKNSTTLNINQSKMGTTEVTSFDTTTDFFDTSAGATFDKANGIFIPKDGYKAYGAQRN